MCEPSTNPLLDLSDCRFSIFFYQKCFNSFMWMINGILVKYAYSFLRLILTLPNLDFITAHSSLITAQMGSVTPYFRPCYEAGINRKCRKAW